MSAWLTRVQTFRPFRPTIDLFAPGPPAFKPSDLFGPPSIFSPPAHPRSNLPTFSAHLRSFRPRPTRVQTFQPFRPTFDLFAPGPPAFKPSNLFGPPSISSSPPPQYPPPLLSSSLAPLTPFRAPPLPRPARRSRRHTCHPLAPDSLPYRAGFTFRPPHPSLSNPNRTRPSKSSSISVII